MMTKILLSLALTVTMYAECTQSQYNNAIHIWGNSIHKKGTQKRNLLTKADNACPNIPIVLLDLKILEAEHNSSSNMDTFKNLKNLSNTLYIDDTERQIKHKYNTAIIINVLWLNYLEKQEAKLASQKGLDTTEIVTYQKWIKQLKSKRSTDDILKAISTIGGLYKADLLFDKNKFKIKNKPLAQDIISTIHAELKNNKDALFGLEGGASSEGNAAYNNTLSKNRAKSLKSMILNQHPQYKNNIKVFAAGESQLVCEAGLLPEINPQGEYQCITKEDREKSRRVSIRRVK
ncbi:MAG: OmpA family protein [Campylobacterota bacterium]|nr:OmpA family protein [Campylobacterota bacterium]